MVNIQRLKGEVKANGLTTTAMAKKMGVSSNTLNELYAGRMQFKLNHVNDICEILNLSKKQRDDIFFANEVPKLRDKA